MQSVESRKAARGGGFSFWTPMLRSGGYFRRASRLHAPEPVCVMKRAAPSMERKWQGEGTAAGSGHETSAKRGASA